MTAIDTPRARATMIIRAPPDHITLAFVEPDRLRRFWLASSSAPLAVGVNVHWRFMVPGAEVETTATRLIPGRAISWNWSNGTTVDIDLEDVDGATAVTIVNSGFQGTANEIVEHALVATEGFAYVLADLKTMLESGESHHILRDKA
jgi:uncharacterized protein YndB with AHSA1/START domain